MNFSRNTKFLLNYVMDEINFFWTRFAAQRRLTIKLLEVFPENELFGFKPTEHLRPFADIAIELLWSEQYMLRGVIEGVWETQYRPETFANKNAMLSVFRIRQETAAAWFRKVTPERFLQSEPDPYTKQPNTMRSRLEEMIEHETHHRGQGYVYLRLLDLEPPDFWVR
jgi:hypothetical protein